MARTAISRTKVTRRGTRTLGYSILGVPDKGPTGQLLFGALTEAELAADDNGVAVRPGMSVQPALAFGIGRDLRHPVAANIAAAIDFVAAAAVISNQGKSFSVTRVKLGVIQQSIRTLNLPLLGCLLECNGELVESAAGTPLIGSAFDAIANLASRTRMASGTLKSGTLLVTGGIMVSVPMKPQSHYAVSFARLGSVWFTTI